MRRPKEGYLGQAYEPRADTPRPSPPQGSDGMNHPPEISQEAARGLLGACKAMGDFWINPPNDIENYRKRAREITDQVRAAILKAQGKDGA